MLSKLDPDFFLCSGDNIYADGPISASVTLPDGSTWRNITTEEKAKVAETLAEFRGNFRYNLLDDPLRAFNAQVPSIIQWDDHEVTNNWFPGEIFADTRYTEKNIDVLAARARQAFSEYFPVSTLRRPDGRVYRVVNHGPLLDVFVLDMRTYRNANSLDNTFGPERVFIKAPTTANVSPAGGYQFFGEVDIDGDSGELTVRLREQDGTVLFTQVLQPGRVG